ncbi:uncharacterized protein F4822DRAFT_435476 [Hypoxylon trugodes]|uniref:uncharacterized protein n=1 Tax=Hypoxylon trugodes TaxID=326681 RepID=UPI00218E2622|nr:uncharacterized protein F4822DRAFT_435476 [Hypoxylon trugodes]KAI1382547.1 hypothetical protein F4822DRAFT_435476 [Hypoxylon trugodes]
MANQPQDPFMTGEQLRQLQGCVHRKLDDYNSSLRMFVGHVGLDQQIRTAIGKGWKSPPISAQNTAVKALKDQPSHGPRQLKYVFPIQPFTQQLADLSLEEKPTYTPLSEGIQSQKKTPSFLDAPLGYFELLGDQKAVLSTR